MANAIVLSGFLPPQHFTGNPLDRHSDLLKRFQATYNPDSEVSLIVVTGRDVVVRPVGPDSTPGVHQDLQALLLRTDDPELDLQGEQLLLKWTPSDGAESLPLPLYLLGLDVQERWTFAVDISPARDLFMDFLRTGCDLEVSLKDLRLLLPTLSLDAAAIAGQAVALSQWHQTHPFCSRCGQETVPTEGGSRRRCIGRQPHKLYPRTDPVVIMLVESPDGHRALLGRSAKSTPGMYTCLSGFIDPCEGIEEAVRREVMEEARVQVSDVQIVGTQPWPIGRYGSCELMIGCVARATSYEVLLNPAEMEDVQWYDRAELRAAVSFYNRPGPLPEIQKRSWSSLGFFIPPPFAVAHHLISAWASREDPWFTPADEDNASQGGTSQAAAAAGGSSRPSQNGNAAADDQQRHRDLDTAGEMQQRLPRLQEDVIRECSKAAAARAADASLRNAARGLAGSASWAEAVAAAATEATAAALRMMTLVEPVVTAISELHAAALQPPGPQAQMAADGRGRSESSRQALQGLQQLVAAIIRS
ncbi:hypothetical protein OEZ85_010345 [Tetradesmus obliquus]|uniref:NAD(+) diphosphatase n=1 Tax=Tetradesmus obliquus TaxID=3088 RepID=A0ABY8TM01_TETOB|nr:hypothetical protein OEZ85_010345 [Tetradesmus obliquus]